MGLQMDFLSFYFSFFFVSTSLTFVCVCGGGGAGVVLCVCVCVGGGTKINAYGCFCNVCGTYIFHGFLHMAPSE